MHSRQWGNQNVAPVVCKPNFSAGGYKLNLQIPDDRGNGDTKDDLVKST